MARPGVRALRGAAHGGLEVLGGSPPPGRGDYQSPVLWEIRMSWEDGRLIAAPTAPLRGSLEVAGDPGQR